MHDLFQILNDLVLEDQKTTGSSMMVPSPDDQPLNISKIMLCWVKRVGFPLVTVDVDEVAKTATLSQSFFRIGAPDKRPANWRMQTWLVHSNMVSHVEQ